MKLQNFDLNLLVCLDALIRERNVSRAAELLNISQPAMSNSLKRLREQLGDPLLVRTAGAMEPTEKALELEPLVSEFLLIANSVLSPAGEFDAAKSDRTFRILASDYVEATLITRLVRHLRQVAPNTTLDILTLSDGSFQDLEKGRIDLAISLFEDIPQSFYQRQVWQDDFTCLMTADNPLADKLDMSEYLAASHLWVSKTGIGVATGMNQSKSRGWVDDCLSKLGHERRIRVYSRHYQNVPLLLRETDMIATLPQRAANVFANDPALRQVTPPFTIEPLEITMAWSPVLHHNNGNQWLRQLIVDIAAIT